MILNNIIKNSFWTTINFIVLTILNFIYRHVFIQQLGIEYLGTNAALLNIIAIISLVELGLGQGIAYFLYAPLAEKNSFKIAIYMNYFKYLYKYMAVIITIIGIVITFYLDNIVNTSLSKSELNSIFLLMIANTVITFIFGYKRIIIIADQKNYKIIPVITIFQLLDVIIKILIAIYFQNLVIILMCQCIVKLIESLVVNKIISRNYKDVLEKMEGSIPKEIKTEVKNKTIAISYHKVGDVLINSTDNIIIASFIGVGILGMLANYSMIIGLITTMLLTFFTSIVSSLGNSIIKDSSSVEDKFYKIQYLCLFVFGLISVNFFLFFSDLITVWVGAEFILPRDIEIILIINFFLLGFRVPLHIIKTSAGLFEKDKYAPIIQGGINLILSMILVKYLGIVGVLVGTLISTICIPIWYQPYIIYKYLFLKKINIYIYKTCKLFLLVCIAFIITHLIMKQLANEIFYNISISILFIEIIISSFLFTISFFILSLRMREFKFFINLILNYKGIMK